MGRADREHLSRTLNSYLNTIHETFQVLNQAPPSSLDRVSWEDVIKIGDQVSRQATIVGMLWSGETPEVKALEENMATYFNVLQGFVLLSHGTTVGAGPTLCSSIHASVKNIIDSSFMLWNESVSSYGSRNKEQKHSIPQLVGAIWDACTALKKTPTTNITAIGRAITQVAVSMKDVLREMKELKPETGPTDEAAEIEECSSDCDLGNDLSPEEMKIAQLATGVVSETLEVIKGLLRAITGLKKDNQENNSSIVDSLEILLKVCQGIGVQIDELGACLYPPQEIPVMKGAVEKILSGVDEMHVEVEKFEGSSDAFFQACNGLRSSLRQMESELGCSGMDDLIPEIQNLSVSE